MIEKSPLGPLPVSPMALGAMHFGTRTSPDVAVKLMDAFVDRGCNFIDTANNYAYWIEGSTGHDSESAIGDWLKSRRRRDDVVIATKVGARPTSAGGDIEEWQGLGRDAIMAEAERSLQHLQTDYIDLYYAHIDDRLTPMEETLAAFDELVRSGKVRAIACSNASAWRIERARQISRQNGSAEYAATQTRHTYFQPKWRADFGFRKRAGERGGWGLEEGTTDEHLDYARSNPDFRIVAYTPLLRGGYSNPIKLSEQYRTPDNQRRRRVLDEVAAETGGSTKQVVLAWLMRSDPTAIPLIAPSDMAQFEDSIAAASLVLTPEQIARMDNAPFQSERSK